MPSMPLRSTIWPTLLATSVPEPTAKDRSASAMAGAKAPRDGKVVDVIATYDPVNKRLIDVKEVKLKDWLS